jgi:AcrR family transcriptional regulator
VARPRAIEERRLLSAAAEVLAEVGPSAFTLERAAVRAEVSAATYVKRFGSKKGLFLALNREWVAAIGPGVEAAIRGRTGADRLRAAAMWGVADMDVPEHAANMLAALALDLADADLQVLLDEGWTLLHTMLAAVAREVAADVPNAPPAEEAARMMFALVEGNRIAWCVRPTGSLEERVRTQLDALLAAWR